MSPAFKLIVGLGNPGSAYQKTRHNAGFWVLDEFANRHKIAFSLDARTQSLVSQFEWESETVRFLKPMQYMNRSGEAVQKVADFYKIAPARILVAHDELDFPPGVAKIKVDGGHGGHNGLRDIVAKLGSGGFTRIRVGIGRPRHKDDVVSYVLGIPPSNEKELLNRAVSCAVDCIPSLLGGRLEVAMNELHR